MERVGNLFGPLLSTALMTRLTFSGGELKDWSTALQRSEFCN